MPFETPIAPPQGATRVEGRPGGRTELDKALKLPPNPDFYLMHHPNGWNLEESDGEFELLPVLKDLVLAGGINRVELTEDGPNSSHARTKLRDSGWIVLEDQDEYRVLVDVEGGIAHRLRWDVISRYPDGTYDLQFDREGWLAFRRSLVEDRVVQPPRPAVVQQLERRLERRLGRRGAKLHVPGVTAAQERDAAALAGLKEAKKSPAEKKAEAARKAAEKQAAAEAKAAEKKAEAEARAAEKKAEAERKTAEKKAEAERKTAEKKAAEAPTS